MSTRSSAGRLPRAAAVVAACLACCAAGAATANALGFVAFGNVSFTVPVAMAPSCSIEDASGPDGGGAAHGGANASAARTFDVPSCGYDTSAGSVRVEFGNATAFGDTGAFRPADARPFASAWVLNEVVLGGALAGPGTLALGISGDYFAFARSVHVVADPREGLVAGSEITHLAYLLRVGAYDAGSGAWSYYFPFLGLATVADGQSYSASGSFQATFDIPVSAAISYLEVSASLLVDSRAYYRVGEPASLALFATALGALLAAARRRRRTTPVIAADAAR